MSKRMSSAEPATAEMSRMFEEQRLANERLRRENEKLQAALKGTLRMFFAAIKQAGGRLEIEDRFLMVIDIAKTELHSYEKAEKLSKVFVLRERP